MKNAVKSLEDFFCHFRASNSYCDVWSQIAVFQPKCNYFWLKSQLVELKSWHTSIYLCTIFHNISHFSSPGQPSNQILFAYVFLSVTAVSKSAVCFGYKKPKKGLLICVFLLYICNCKDNDFLKLCMCPSNTLPFHQPYIVKGKFMKHS